MSFIAKIKIDGEELNVLHCGFRFSQVTDATGKPTSVPQGGNINLILESTGSTNLFDWMISPTQTKSGVITFYRRDSMSKLKTVEFGDAHCVDYYETFDHDGDSPMQLQITISAHEIKLNDSEFRNNWPE
ncbi:MAG: type VI secretion system tube protein TssD [Ferruginibacter sp.]